MDLAGFIKQVRTAKELSLRDLSSDLDHAYIWRLEKGTKTSPSDASLEKLAQALMLNARERDILHLLAEQPVDDALFNLMVSRTDFEWDDFLDAARMSSRGERPTTEESWLRRIERLRELD
jgi:HTH-type transcriptional regulator, competence development regulator